MIENQQHYTVTQRAIARFETALAEAREAGVHLPAPLKQAMLDAIESELAVLRDQVADYERRRISEHPVST
jgi:hypothetical protein